jgi:ADP-ribose pyrophosphatase YjhB (NUDIX family)
VLLERTADDGGEPEILLLKRAVEPGLGAWDLPAGYLDPGESFEMAARRETLEEAGIEIELLGLVGVYHSPPANAVTAVFRAQAARQDARVTLDFESTDHAWVARSEVGAWLPRLAFASMTAAVADWAGHNDR